MFVSNTPIVKNHEHKYQSREVSFLNKSSSYIVSQLDLCDILKRAATLWQLMRRKSWTSHYAHGYHTENNQKIPSFVTWVLGFLGSGPLQGPTINYLQEAAIFLLSTYNRPITYHFHPNFQRLSSKNVVIEEFQMEQSHSTTRNIIFKT